MLCNLMHKRIAVADIELDDATGFIQKVNTVYAPAHLPVGIPFSNGKIDRAALNAWWTDRSIPASRSGIREALEILDVASTKLLLLRCYGLSLSDHYWICPHNSGLTREKINFFENPFSDDIGDVLFGEPKKDVEFDFSSPDNTSDGYLKKRWKVINGKRFLIKGGSNPFQQQPFNEVIATEIMERLKIPHVPYTLLWNDGYPYSVCEDFVTPDTELVSAWRIMNAQKKRNDESQYRHFINCCQSLGANVDHIISALDRMLVLDYIIANEDRHLNNFGLLRDPETLEWIGMAPVFDNGSSLGYDRMAGRIANEMETVCKPFKKRHEDQIKLVTRFDWIDFDALSDVGEFIRKIFAGEALDFVGAERVEVIARTVEKRINVLHEITMMQHFEVTHDVVEGDVEKNVAEDYTPKKTM